jgi:hypothetical protein
MLSKLFHYYMLIFYTIRTITNQTMLFIKIHKLIQGYLALLSRIAIRDIFIHE